MHQGELGRIPLECRDPGIDGPKKLSAQPGKAGLVPSSRLVDLGLGFGPNHEFRAHPYFL